MKPTLKDGKRVYACAFGHSHSAATLAVLCEQAPRIDVRARFELVGSDLVEGYECKRCGAQQRSAFRGLLTIEHREARGSGLEGEPGTQVARAVGCADPDEGEWRAEAARFHDAHSGCNTEEAK